jgi:hypothetical protein
MQPIKTLTNWLQQHANSESYLFTLHDLRPLYPNMSYATFKTLLSRAVKQELLKKVCRGLYAFNSASNSSGLLLFHVAAYIRSDEFNYISLETALSDAGIISQIPLGLVTIMSSGRSNKISCGNFGTIEFIHTSRKPTEIIDQLTYDENCRLWRAKPKLAFEDMKRTHRDCGLVNGDQYKNKYEQKIMTTNFSDTITAQATPPGRGGVSIIRVSGPLVASIAQKILGKIPKVRHADFCDFLANDQTIIDQGLALYFSAPHSFTG